MTDQFKPLRSSYPIGHILNPATPYRTGADVAATFARAREQMQREAKSPKVEPIRRRAK